MTRQKLQRLAMLQGALFVATFATASTLALWLTGV